jgi:hypothetical protein
MKEDYLRIHARQQASRRVCATPFSGRRFVCFGEGGINVNRAEHLGESQTMFHSKNELREQITCMLAHDGYTEDPVLAGHGEHLDESLGRAVRNCTVRFM